MTDQPRVRQTPHMQLQTSPTVHLAQSAIQYSQHCKLQSATVIITSRDLRHIILASHDHPWKFKFMRNADEC